MATSIEDTQMPRRNAMSRASILSRSPTRTKNVPTIAEMMPAPAITKGSKALLESKANPAAIATVVVATIAPTYDSKRSPPMPAMSPTLSPTLSAITAGFLGSSSGIPASTLPTKSEPTSAALVKIPPPTLANRAMEDAPAPNPTRMSAILAPCP
ncbi:MAG: hypothetical protein DDT32_01965 [Syntrophomonadaceae bacterium]|nr:hypothetical protein [Bacillota bacterium]